MTRQQLVTSLMLYKKEVMRRGIVIAVAGLLPGVAIFLGIGLSVNPLSQSTAYIVTFFSSFVFFVCLLLGAYIYMVCKSLPRKLELLCPHCGAFILDTPADTLIAEGKCESCGKIIIHADTVTPVQTEVVHT